MTRTERILKILVCLGLVGLYFKYLIVPMMMEFNADRQLLAGARQAARNAPEQQHVQEALMQKVAALGFEEISRLLPAFDQARSNLWAKVEAVKAEFDGKWELLPGPSFTTDGKIIRWPFTLRIEGTFSGVVSALAKIEGEGQVVRVRSLKVARREPRAVALEATMEMLFLDTFSADSLNRIGGRP
jgi:hypothetical protein